MHGSEELEVTRKKISFDAIGWWACAGYNNSNYYGWVISAALKQWPLSNCSRLFQQNETFSSPASDQADTVRAFF